MMRKRAMPAALAIGLAAAAVTAAADPGQDVYQKACVACHGANGKGILPGIPDLTRKGGVLAKPDDVLLKHVTEGFKSPGSPMAMPPKGGNPSLTEAQLRAALQYAKREFGK